MIPKEQETCRLLIFAKAPVPGEAKSRLVPFLGREGAARLHAHLVLHTLDTALASKVGPVELWCSSAVSHPFFVECAQRFPIGLRRQRGQNLGERMSHAFRESLKKGGVALLIGTDCPSLRPEDLQEAKEALDEGVRVVLSPAEDGGYVLLGLRQHTEALFEGIPWGSDSVLAQTRQRLEGLGWSWRELAARWDVDRPEDVERLRRLGWGFLIDGKRVVDRTNKVC